ncbi:spore coat protein D [Amphibacillus marinus]|uniref:Spore coat protein D n=1 Tax=Amphibacillus marinus TaxID=872970 RepID=A0A1H8GK42_9BACI|nr:CotD family spore coat protein [Amphibacillus marinus]SEN44386.1 spore coat protein D [Amphibacillus marinus]
MRRHPCCPAKTIVCPTKHQQVNTCSQSQVNYVHPTHTTVTDHHTVQNTHWYPQSTSWGQTVNQTNVYGGQTWPGGYNGVQGAQSGYNNNGVQGVQSGYNHCCKR